LCDIYEKMHLNKALAFAAAVAAPAVAAPDVNVYFVRTGEKGADEDRSLTRNRDKAAPTASPATVTPRALST